jgi:dihydroxyacetone kinase
MKKLIGRADAVVADMIAGLVRADARLRRIEGHAVIVRADARALAEQGKVALVSGGGSGHEPAHAGYVGRGMLTAAVLGEVFTSPAVDAVLEAIRAVTGPAGCLLIVKNYTGDRLNFGLAATIARGEGLAVEMILVDDDAALEGASRVGRRGLAGTVLIHKIAGAAAERGLRLKEVRAIAEGAVGRLATMGIGLTPCTVPIAGKPNFALGEDEMEFGLGIHGEPGIERVALSSADAIVCRLIDGVIRARRFTPDQGPVLLMINGLGGTPAMELAIVARVALAELDRRGFDVARIAVGTFLTALEMAGCSLSLLALDSQDLPLLDVDTDAPAWTGLTKPGTMPAIPASTAIAASSKQAGPTLDPVAADALRLAAQAVIACLIASEETLTALDRAVGDGDLGINLARGARAVAERLERIPFAQPAAAFEEIAEIVRRVVGGTSGPLTAALLVGAAGALRASDSPDLAVWTGALADGCAAIAEIGGARRGDRTMLDGLLPALDALAAAAAQGCSGAEAMARAALAAEAGADATRLTVAAVGRSAYLGQRAVGHPDPGAWAAALWLRAVADSLTSAPDR